MAIDMSRIKQRQLETSRQSGNFWRPSEGKNIIRVFKFEHKVTKEDVENKYYDKKMLNKTADDIDRPVKRHFNVSSSGKPMISNKRLMKEWIELKNSSNPNDKKRAQEVAPSTAYFMNVVNILDSEQKISLYSAPRSVYNSMLEYIGDEEYGESLLGCEGRDFVINYDKSKNGSERYQVRLRAEGKSDKLSSSLENDVLDLYTEEAYRMMGEEDSTNMDWMEEKNSPINNMDNKNKIDDIDDVEENEPIEMDLFEKPNKTKNKKK